MKITAVEWLTGKLRIEFGFVFSNNILEKAKIIEENKNEQFAIGFAEWLLKFDNLKNENNYIIEQLLEMYKNENKENI